VRIGIDVGGTNTDAVLIDRQRVRAWRKAPTSTDVSSGISQALSEVMGQANVAPSELETVVIGTTHFTNAVVERRHLLKVGVLRIALPATQGLPPLVDWPEDIKDEVKGSVIMVRGGYQYDGRLNSTLDTDGVRQAARQFRELGLTSIAISGLFSPVNGEMELEAEAIIRDVIPDARITLSHKIGRLGLLERENAAIMNASLADLSTAVVQSFRQALKDMGITAPFYVSQNDGTLMSADVVEKYPVLTFASGPTNSMRGAAFLSGLDHALVADIGGTTTDIGMLVNGFPRESSVNVNIGGVRTNFRMPDILALGLGGGSIITTNDAIKVGPQSVGYQILNKALVFGGDTLTTTDIAVAAGYADIGDRSRVMHLPPKIIKAATDIIHQRIEEGIDRMKTSGSPVPLILVGGGAVLVGRPLAGVSDTVVPEFASVANAIGAAIAMAGGEVDKVYSYAKVGRDAAMAEAKAEATAEAVAAGADPDTVKILDIEEIPLAYVPGGAVRLRVRAAGDLQTRQPPTLSGKGQKVAAKSIGTV
jgi:N-methylhydantoinase A/oxoprolinase/acetone carboxylase beta subunit